MPRESVLKFYKKGPDNQRSADAIFRFMRPDAKKIQKWTDEEKLFLMEFMKGVSERFNEYKREIATLTKIKK